jgi:transposase InsO family protein
VKKKHKTKKQGVIQKKPVVQPTLHMCCCCGPRHTLIIFFVFFRPQSTPPCQDCIAGKQHRHPFPGAFSVATEPCDVIQSDVVGPLPPSHSGFCYLVTFIDEFTRYVTIFAMVHKSDVLRCFQLFLREFERRHSTTVKTIHSDNGG